MVGTIEGLKQMNKELKEKADANDQERFRTQENSRKNGDQLRDMAEKVFQLLEKLKLSELGKMKAMEAMRKKEQEVLAAKKTMMRLAGEVAREEKGKMKVWTVRGGRK